MDPVIGTIVGVGGTVLVAVLGFVANLISGKRAKEQFDSQLEQARQQLEVQRDAEAKRLDTESKRLQMELTTARAEIDARVTERFADTKRTLFTEGLSATWEYIEALRMGLWDYENDRDIRVDAYQMRERVDAAANSIELYDRSSAETLRRMTRKTLTAALRLEVARRNRPAKGDDTKEKADRMREQLKDAEKMRVALVDHMRRSLGTSADSVGGKASTPDAT